uniref:Chromo domain-containing protein n=1 Tax=Naja naja TaxID=35670 RepID=A0A8C6XQ95_NAJNA
MDHEEYEVDSIRDSHQLRGQFQYLVAWKGYGPEDFTWVDATDVDAPHLVQDFHARFPQHPHPPGPRGEGPVGGDNVMPLVETDSEEEEEQPTGSGSVAPEVVEETGEGQRLAEQSEERAMILLKAYSWELCI